MYHQLTLIPVCTYTNTIEHLTPTHIHVYRYVQAGSVLNNYANIFEVLMRLRQAIDHPYLVIHSNTQVSTEKKRKI